MNSGAKDIHYCSNISLLPFPIREKLTVAHLMVTMYGLVHPHELHNLGVVKT